jgi:hypothetical protein
VVKRAEEMIHIEWPELFFILPLPLLVRWLLPAQAPTVLAALKVPFIEDFGSAKTGGVSEQRPWLLGVAVMAWVLLVIASSRPQWLGEPIEQAVSGRDLMLAVDVSGSMDEKEFFY